MDADVLIALVVGAAVLLVLSFAVAGIPLIWYVAGAVCLFTGLTGPALACLGVGLVIHVFQWRRKAPRR